jgi:hypothetical protein
MFSPREEMLKADLTTEDTESTEAGAWLRLGKPSWRFQFRLYGKRACRRACF